MSIVFCQNNWKNQLAIRFVFQKGYEVEKTNQLGWLHFAEHMMFGKIPGLSEKELENFLSENFYFFEAKTSLSELSVDMSFGKSLLKDNLNVFFQMLYSWDISKTAFNTQKKDLISETEEYFSDDFFQIRKELFEMLGLKRFHGLMSLQKTKNYSFLQLSELKIFWNKYLKSTSCKVFCYGKYSDSEKNFVSEMFSDCLFEEKEKDESYVLKTKKFISGKNVSALYYESNKAHFFDILFEYLLFYRCEILGDGYLMDYMRLKNKSVFYAYSCSFPDSECFSKLLTEKPDLSEFEFSKRKLLNELFRCEDFLDIKEDISFISSMLEGKFFPVFGSIGEYVHFIKKAEFKDFLEYFMRISV